MHKSHLVYGRKTIVYFFMLMSLLFINYTAQAQDSSAIIFSLKQCIETAVSNNADVMNASFTAQSNKVNYQQAKGNALPFASAGITHGITQGRSINPYTNSYINQQNTYAGYNLNAYMSLWNNGSITNNIRATNLNFEASEMDLQQAKDNVTLNVILDYLQVLSNEELLDVTIKQTEITKTRVEKLTLENNEGAIPPATLYDMKGQQSGEELNVINARNALQNSKIALTQLMNIPFPENMEVQHIEVDSNLMIYDGNASQIYQQALQNLALVKATQLRKQSSAKALRSVRGGLYPTLSLNGGLATNYSSAAETSTLINTTNVQTDNYVLYNSDKLFLYTPQSNYTNEKITYGNQWRNNFNSNINISLQIPVLNGLYQQSRVKHAAVALKQNEFADKTTRTQLQQNVESAYANMNAAFERYKTARDQVEAYTLSFHSAEIKFNEGVLTSVDYMIAKNNVDDAQINLISAKYDYALRMKILDYYKGKPLW